MARRLAQVRHRREECAFFGAELMRCGGVDPQHAKHALARRHRRSQDTGESLGRCRCSVLKAWVMAHVGDRHWRTAQDRLVDPTFGHLDRAFV